MEKENKEINSENPPLINDANLLFPPNDCFSMVTSVTCEKYVFEQERIMCNLGGLEILSHVEKDKPCYNYVRLNKDYFDKNKYKYINCNYIEYGSSLYRGEKKYIEKYNNYIQNQKLGDFNYIQTKDVPEGKGTDGEKERYESFCKFITEKLEKKQITYNYFNINTINIDNRDIIFGPRFFVKPREDIDEDIDKKRVNISLGVVFVKGNDGKNYAIMCNHSNNLRIEKLKKIFKDMGNTEIINLPQIQYDLHHCSILNKDFLQTMSEFFKNKDVSEAVKELKDMQNKPDLALKTFPKLYQYRQHDVEGLKNDIEGVDIDNNINYLPITDVYNFELKDNKPKKMNCGLLIYGWKIALDYALANKDDISVIELEKFYNVLTKQIKFFDDLKDLQIKNNDTKKYSDLFDKNKIKHLSKIVEERKKKLKRNEDGLLTSINKIDIKYIEKRKKEIIDNMNIGRAYGPNPLFLSNNIKKEILDYFNKNDFLLINRIQEYLEESGKNIKKLTLQDMQNIFLNEYLKTCEQNESFNKLFERKKPFENNNIIQFNDIQLEHDNKEDVNIEPQEIVDSVINGTLDENISLNTTTIKGIIDLSLGFQIGGIHSWPFFIAEDNRREAMRNMADKINNEMNMVKGAVIDPEWFLGQLVEISKLKTRGCCDDIYNIEGMKFVKNTSPNHSLDINDVKKTLC